MHKIGHLMLLAFGTCDESPLKFTSVLHIDDQNK